MVVVKRQIIKLMFFQIFFIWLARFFIENLGVSYVLVYLTEVTLICEFLYICKNIRKSFKDSDAKYILKIIVLIFISTIISWMINGQSILIYIWGARHLYKIFIFFTCCIVMFSLKNVEKVFRWCYVLLVVNFFFCTYEYVVLNLSQDWLGGTFGNTPGCNSIMNLLFCIMLLYSITGYMYKKVTLRKLLIVCVLTLYMATLAELTVYFVEFVLIIVLSIILSNPIKKPNLKTILIVGIVIIGIVIGMNIFKNIFPEHYEILTNWSKVIEYLGGNAGSTGVYTISRLRVFEQMRDLFFENNTTLTLFGMGLGSCDTTSSFYMIYGPLYHYDWFTSAITFLETGYIGIVLLLGFYCSIFIHSATAKRRTNNRDNIRWHIFTQIMAVLMVILTFYNSTIRDNYCCYIMAFSLSISCIVSRENKRRELNNGTE